jgi:hypothetical protein
VLDYLAILCSRLQESNLMLTCVICWCYEGWYPSLRW